jgi:hypothetical protein
LCSDIASWLVRQPHPVIVIDWSDATRNRRWVLLRAAVPVGGRTLTLLDQVVPLKQVADPRIERAFLLSRIAVMEPPKIGVMAPLGSSESGVSDGLRIRCF